MLSTRTPSLRDFHVVRLQFLEQTIKRDVPTANISRHLDFGLIERLRSSNLASLIATDHIGPSLLTKPLAWQLLDRRIHTARCSPRSNGAVNACNLQPGGIFGPHPDGQGEDNSSGCRHVRPIRFIVHIAVLGFPHNNHPGFYLDDSALGPCDQVNFSTHSSDAASIISKPTTESGTESCVQAATNILHAKYMRRNTVAKHVERIRYNHAHDVLTCAC
ncbi:hypothetical protein C8R43DRAFT_1130426 [Mycena crocata]|nr:hypothetical protein C8R43DRAFT_1130426 [Mycena crocata]